MRPAGPTANEAERLRALRALAILDTPREERFDRIVRRVTTELDVPIALVSLVDEERQWFKACIGMDGTSTGRDVSFCGHAIHRDEIFVVEDASKDPDFADNPLVTGDPHIRFYAGRPLRAVGGERIGTLCMIDTEPRVLTAREAELLDDFAAWVETELRAGELTRAISTFTELEQLRDQLVSAVSHEMRSPLTALLGSLRFVLATADQLAEDQAEMIRVAMRNGDRLKALADDLLLLARLDAAPEATARVEVDLAAVTTEVVDEVERTSPYDVRFRTATPEGPAVVLGDAEQLRQAIANLVTNAAKYSPAGSKVDVSVTVADGRVVVAVADAGVGISAEDLPRLSERFFRASSAGSVPGTGLGLAITRSIIEQHGGELSITSTLGEGSTFAVEVPAADVDVEAGRGKPT